MYKKIVFPSSGRIYDSGYIVVDRGDNVVEIVDYYAIVAHGYLSDIWRFDKEYVLCVADEKEECETWAREHGYRIE